MASVAPELNENHRRVLASSLVHLDNLLNEIDGVASGATVRSPFAPYAPDLGPGELRLLRDFIAELRRQMAHMAAALGIDPARPTTPVSRAVEVMLLGAEIGLEEVGADQLGGYGPLTPAGVAAVDRFVGELSRRLQQLRRLLARRSAGDLPERIARITDAPIDLAVLRALERVIARHGLVMFRDALELLVHRLERETFDIAVFGRVNAGKSSLLNAVLGTDALPVGVTPVTAVPTRIIWGPVAEATVATAGAQLAVPPARLREFVSEEENADNHKQVRSVVLRLPSSRLAGGVVFVDTPGVGSLATAGASESYAYVPRCDFGILVIDAATPPTPDDVDLLRRLHASALPATVVLTKADLLADTEVERVREYAASSLARHLGMEIGVHAVSTRGGGALRAERWFADAVAPLLSQGRALAAAAARQRCADLVRAVLAALPGNGAAPHNEPERSDDRLESIAAAGDRGLRAARSRCERAIDRLRASAPEVIDAVVPIVARRMAEHRDDTLAADAIATALEVVASRDGDAVQQALVTARAELNALVTRACAVAPYAATPAALQVDLLARPRLVVPPDLRALVVPLPRWLRHVQPVLRRRLASALHRHVDRLAAEVLQQHAASLHAWVRHALAALAQQLAAQLDPIRAAARAPARTAAAAAAGADEDPDVALLRRASADADRANGAGPAVVRSSPPAETRAAAMESACSPER
jgi:GTP-binding protein EngB required for normal cell division